MLRVRKNNKAVRYILNHLRLEDKQELIAKYGRRKYKKKAFADIKKFNFDIGIDKTTLKPFIMGGCNVVDKNNSDIGIVWLLSTNLVYKNGISLLKVIKKEFEIIDKKYFITCNYIYEKNFTAKKWLERLGYKFVTTKECQTGFEYFYRINKLKGLS